jgi:hypothetical protein
LYGVSVADEADPPRKNYGFKEREFKRDNRRASSAPPMPTAQDLAKLADVGGALRSDGSTAGGKQTSGHKAPPTSNNAKRGDPNDVHAVLAANREVEKKFGGDAVKITTTGSRKKRDYWLVFITLEVVFGGVVALGIKQSNPFFLVFGLTGMVIFGIAITWIMWQLVDRY